MRMVGLYFLSHVLVPFIIILVPVVDCRGILSFVISVFEFGILLFSQDPLHFAIPVIPPPSRVIGVGPVPRIIIAVSVIQGI